MLVVDHHHQKNLLPPIPHALVHSQWQSVWYTYSVTLSAAGFNPTNSCSCRSYYYSGNTIVLFCPDTVFHATSTFFSASSHTTRVTHWHTEKNSKLQRLHYIHCSKGQAKQSKKKRKLFPVIKSVIKRITIAAEEKSAMHACAHALFQLFHV